MPETPSPCITCVVITACPLGIAYSFTRRVIDGCGGTPPPPGPPLWLLRLLLLDRLLLLLLLLLMEEDELLIMASPVTIEDTRRLASVV